MLATFLILQGRVYYLAPAYPVLLAAGAIVFERWLEPLPNRAWLKPAYVTALLSGGVIFAPFALPILPVKTYTWYSRTLHYTPPRIETHKMGPLPQIYADMFGWPEIVATVARVYYSLPPEERAKTAIICGNYGQAGAIDFFGPQYGLPKAISPHQNYFYWGPRDYSTESLIVLGDSRESLERKCPNVEELATVYHKYSMPYEHFPLLLCRGPKRPLKEIWPKLKNWD